VLAARPVEELVAVHLAVPPEDPLASDEEVGAHLGARVSESWCGVDEGIVDCQRGHHGR
jgi:hypothetical protein